MRVVTIANLLIVIGFSHDNRKWYVQGQTSLKYEDEWGGDFVVSATRHGQQLSRKWSHVCGGPITLKELKLYVICSVYRLQF